MFKVLGKVRPPAKEVMKTNSDQEDNISNFIVNDSDISDSEAIDDVCYAEITRKLDDLQLKR